MLLFWNRVNFAMNFVHNNNNIIIMRNSQNVGLTQARPIYVHACIPQCIIISGNNVLSLLKLDYQFMIHKATL